MQNSDRFRSNNFFEIENARNMTREEVARTFVPTGAFWRLLSPKNHIVLGSRGSGKTVLAKMISHDHLSLFDDERTKSIIKDASLIGIYVPTKLDWMGTLLGISGSRKEEQLERFRWQLNIETCKNFLSVASSCALAYGGTDISRAFFEAELSSALGKEWASSEGSFSSFVDLRRYLRDMAHKKLIAEHLKTIGSLEPREASRIGSYFDLDILLPLRRAIDLTAQLLRLSDTNWLLCIDEIEYLEERHHRLLNSFLRTHSEKLFFKFTTMPYFHHTLDTETASSLSEGHDFEYVYVDQELVGTTLDSESDMIPNFAISVFNKRAKLSSRRIQKISLRKFLGQSRLIDPKPNEWDEGSHMWGLLDKFADPVLKKRAYMLYSDPRTRSRFMNEIARKIHGALLLRESVFYTKGRSRLSIYSGASLVVRCSDGNPRRLIRIFNSMLLEAGESMERKGEPSHVFALSPERQTRILLQFSANSLNRVLAEQKGQDLHELIETIGQYMYVRFHERSLTTDQVSSVFVNVRPEDEVWDLIKRAVGLGLLFPLVNASNPDQLPVGKGTFHLAFVLAPHFRLLPRRDKSRALSNILTDRRGRFRRKEDRRGKDAGQFRLL